MVKIISLVLLSLILATPAWAVQASATLSWTDVQGEDSYRVERSDAGAPYAPVGTVGANVTTFVNSPLALSTLYCWRLVAANAFGESTPSAPACAQADTPGQIIGVQILLTPIP